MKLTIILGDFTMMILTLVCIVLSSIYLLMMIVALFVKRKDEKRLPKEYIPGFILAFFCLANVLVILLIYFYRFRN